MGQVSFAQFCIINDKRELIGLITDGDLRRKLTEGRSLSSFLLMML